MFFGLFLPVLKPLLSGFVVGGCGFMAGGDPVSDDPLSWIGWGKVKEGGGLNVGGAMDGGRGTPSSSWRGWRLGTETLPWIAMGWRDCLLLKHCLHLEWV